MIPMLYYFLQVIVCSGILYAYYLFALRNKGFHHYNRFYLLSVLLVSWFIPLLRIPVTAIVTAPVEQVLPLKIFEVVADNNTHLEAYVASETTPFSWSTALSLGYWSVCMVLGLVFMLGLVRIWRLLRKHSSRYINNAVVVTTNAKGTPFSFFRFIFWNNEIDIESHAGKQILAHELVHVKEKHSLDKIIGAVVLSLGWFNPFFWLAKKELYMVHEFIADKKAANNDPSALAQMLLTASYPSIGSSLANSFFHSPVKRRLSMMTKFNITKYPYLRRLLVLPLLCLVILLFAFRKQVATIVGVEPADKVLPLLTASIPPRDWIYSPDIAVKKQVTAAARLNRVFNVMIDAGHGGFDAGAIGNDGTKESDLVLELAKVIAEQNTNENLRISFTRTTDIYQHPVKKMEILKDTDADVFVSIHAAASPDKKLSGIDIFIPTWDTLSHYKASYLLANTIANTMSVLGPKVQIRNRQVGIWVVNKADRPAVLIETGFISNHADLMKLKDKSYQVELAKAILKGIELYLKELGC